MQSLLLLGTGRMARAYASVLSALKIETQAVSRSEEHAKIFSSETGVPAIGGSIEAWKKTSASIPSHAILAIDVAELPAAAMELLELGVTSLLLEKPGALSKDALVPLRAAAEKRGASIAVGYNRRYLASVQKARELITEDGGARSCYFEFNERTTQPERIKSLNTPPATVARWFIANSTHVVDLAFYLAGEPRTLAGFSAAGPLWAPHPTLYAGGGITKIDVPFSYFANWEIDGPWTVEIQTAKRKLILNPLEKLFEEKNGALNEVAFDNTQDTAFRPGLFRQVELFLKDSAELPTLAHQIERFDWYERIERGSD